MKRNLYLLLILLHIPVLSVRAEITTRTLVRTGHILDVKTGAEPAAPRAGTLEAGKWADIIAVNGDPLKDVRLLQHIPFAMKSGIVYKDETHKQ